MTPVTCLCWTLLSVGLVLSVSEEQEAESGQNIILPCEAPAGKSIKMVKWTRADLGDEYVLLLRDDQLVLANQNPSFKDRVDLQGRQMKTGDMSLILKNVTAADGGQYQCQGFVGETRSWQIVRTISLKVAPPGQGGGATEDGGSVGLIVGLSVAAAALIAATAAGFVVYRKQKQSQGSY